MLQLNIYNGKKKILFYKLGWKMIKKTTFAHLRLYEARPAHLWCNHKDFGSIDKEVTSAVSMFHFLVVSTSASFISLECGTEKPEKGCQ